MKENFELSFKSLAIKTLYLSLQRSVKRIPINITYNYPLFTLWQKNNQIYQESIKNQHQIVSNK